MNTTSDHNQSYIDSPEKLLELCQHLQQQSFFTIDTEFVREQTYYPKLCLIQIATDSVIACIDPLVIEDMTPLFKILIAPDIVKVFHAARQDIETFYNLFEDCPRPVFDTQVAAGLLGYPDQIGYANLVEKMLDVQLDKKHTRTDWSKRPLSSEQIQYAADDVRYLYKIYPMLLQQLKQAGRDSWLQADFEFLTNIETYKPDMENLWKKVAGQQKLKPQQLTVLSELAKWRELTAQKYDKPRKWILSDDTLVMLAIHVPQSIEQLETIRFSRNGVSDKQKQHIVEIINSAMAIPKENWIKIPKFQKLTNEQTCIVDALMCVARSYCNDNNIALASITTRKELEAIAVQAGSDSQLMKGWRYQIVGKNLEAFLAGKIKIEMSGNKLLFEQT